MKYKDLYDDRFGYPGTYDLKQCRCCNHIFLQADFTESELQHLYTHYYPRSSVKVEDFKPLQETVGFKAWFNGEKRSFSEVPPRVRVLDIGCGFGEALAYHASRGCDAYGIETDENALRVSEKYGFKVKVGVFGPGLYDESYFDYVTMDQVLEHSSNPHLTLSEIHRILKPQGKLVVTMPNAFGWGARFFGRFWINWHTPYHLNFFSRKSVLAAAEQAGFKTVKLKTVTSSEWLYYQKLHLLAFPSKAGEPSIIWSHKRNAEELSAEAKERREKIVWWHRKKLNHLITRLFDFFGAGDNFLIVFEKK